MDNSTDGVVIPLFDRESLILEMDALLAERYSLVVERDGLIIERNSLIVERDNLKDELRAHNLFVMNLKTMLGIL